MVQVFGTGDTDLTCFETCCRKRTKNTPVNTEKCRNIPFNTEKFIPIPLQYHSSTTPVPKHSIKIHENTQHTEPKKPIPRPIKQKKCHNTGMSCFSRIRYSNLVSSNTYVLSVFETDDTYDIKTDVAWWVCSRNFGVVVCCGGLLCS